MRFVEINSGIRVPVSNDEQVVSEIIKNNHGPMPKSSLNIREQELARQLVHKGIIDRVMIDEHVYFVYNEFDD